MPRAAIFPPVNFTPVSNGSLTHTEFPRPQPSMADVMKALDTVNKNIHALSKQVQELERNMTYNINNYTYQCSNTSYDYITGTIPTDFQDKFRLVTKWTEDTLVFLMSKPWPT
jgi:hypothetical protein